VHRGGALGHREARALRRLEALDCPHSSRHRCRAYFLINILLSEAAKGAGFLLAPTKIGFASAGYARGAGGTILD
jgi:hypothetical protein